VALILLVHTLGWAAWIGVGILVVLIPVQARALPATGLSRCA
jgi:hypothetical protein